MSKFEFKMPKLGESITEAAIITWFKNKGDFIEVDETLLEVATDKVDSEIPSTVTGIIEELFYEANAVVNIGETIAIIETDGSTSSEKPTVKKEKVEIKRVDISKKKTAKVVNNIRQSTQKTNTFFSPLIISIAKDQHISFEELSRIPASGKDGRLRKSDVFQYIENGRPYKFAPETSTQDPTTYRIPQLNLDKGKGKIVEMDRMRQMIADHMVYSKHTSPHVTAYAEVDLTELVLWRNSNKIAFQEKYGEKLTFTPLFIEAVGRAIKDFPNINASVDGKNIIVKPSANIGMAAALPNGNLIVPVVKNVNKKNLKEIATEVNALTLKARNNALIADDIKGGTFTISNVGTFGSLMGTPIINQPEVAILALGIIKKRAEVMSTAQGDKIEIRSMMYLSLSFDHRVVDGHLGGSFLKRVSEYLEKFDAKRKI